jgi:hypothetical protein
VSYRKGESLTPSTKLSDYVALIQKGVLSENADERKKKLFEATLKLTSLPVGATLNDVKVNLIGFHSEFYAEKIPGHPKRPEFYLHFYNIYRA